MKIIVGDENYEKACRILAAADIGYVPVGDVQEDRFYDSLQKMECKKAAEHLTEAFVWSDSKEGNNYWREVHDKLSRYGEE